MKKNKKKKNEELEEVEEIEIENDEIEEENEEHKSHKVLNFFIFVVLIVVLVFFYSKYVGTKGLIVKEYRVESNILTDNYSGLKIIHFSDLLYKSTVDKNDVKDIVERINLYRPDIVVFTGDLVSNNVKITKDDTSFLIEELSKINANIGKYAIYGDYDYSYSSYEKVMEDSNFKLLNNTYETIYYKTREPLYIVGLPSSIKESIDIDTSFEFYDDNERSYTIVLVHDGKSIKSIDDSTYEVDLILGGHSLNGSVVLPFYGGLFKDNNSYKYSEPKYTKGITNIFISSGIGTKNKGYRFLNKPSINLYRLKAQS